MNEKTFSVLGVPFFLGTQGEVIENLQTFFRQKTGALVATPNPEMLVESYRFSVFKEVLLQMNMRICDGVGVVFASGGKLIRYPGIDCMLDTLALCEKEGKSVFFFGGVNISSQNALLAKVRHFFPKLCIAGSIVPGDYRLRKNKKEYSLIVPPSHEENILRIIEAKPDVLFVALGHGKQECFMMDYAKKIPSLSFAIGVGGSFDILSGERKRAPRLMRQMGFEWLWRLLCEPRRLPRILNAVFVFPCFVLWNFFVKK